ncbi:MAG: tRNA (N6-isopentenyl adenosine(37)-C2)-methylthiotransferase MiaB [Anaerolineaceae bacterium]|nr:tRNA (N6-isopentenyl adenosine(37)-C2)-methylthiotransferase MiaB [Anaerolineaceae bacterium]
MKYHIWTYGCQMNTADSQLLISELERTGLRAAADPTESDLYIINTCVVRQSAENKAYSRLQQLKRYKEDNPAKIIALMGCLVGVKDPLRLRKQLPHVDVFLPPSEPQPLLQFLNDRNIEAISREEDQLRLAERYAIQDGELLLPMEEQGQLVSAHVPVVYGCSHACSFCIIPFRRGIERSRSVGKITAHVRSLAQQGVKEVTLLGQIVDRYGVDIPDGPNLAQLLRVVHREAEECGLERIRFLTSHPNWMTEELLETVAELPKVMPQIEVPVQSGDDEVLARMKRGYRVQDYRKLVETIRSIIPQVAIHTDIIVGFPGESDAQFQHTYDLLAELKLDKAHLARYSPRPHTVSARRMEDDVPEAVKKIRHQRLDDLQKRVVAEINQHHLGETVQVLVEDTQRDKWRGRTPQNKLVFFDDERDWRGKLVEVQITWTGPWSMQARLSDANWQPNGHRETISLTA